MDDLFACKDWLQRVIDLPSEVAQLSPKLVDRFLILVGQGNPKGAVSGRVVQVQPQMYVKIHRYKKGVLKLKITVI